MVKRRHFAGQITVLSFLLAMPFQAVYAQLEFKRVHDPDFDVKVARPAFIDWHPKVLFDEAHFNYHTSDGWYKPFMDLITNDGCRVTPNKQKFSADALHGFDILLIASALSPPPRDPNDIDPAFTKEECEAVYDWVQAGGCLLLIADHAPTGAMAEIMANRFGVDMGKGWAADIENHDSSGSESRLVFNEKNGLLGDHPIIRGRDADEQIEHVVTFGGQSLKGPDGSVVLLKLSDTAVEIENLQRSQKPQSAKGRAQAVAFSCGNGRVVVLGESGIYTACILSAEGMKPSKMGMNFPGTDNRQFALNVIRWLAGPAK